MGRGAPGSVAWALNALQLHTCGVFPSRTIGRKPIGRLENSWTWHGLGRFFQTPLATACISPNSSIK